MSADERFGGVVQQLAERGVEQLLDAVAHARLHPLKEADPRAGGAGPARRPPAAPGTAGCGTAGMPGPPPNWADPTVGAAPTTTVAATAAQKNRFMACPLAWELSYRRRTPRPRSEKVFCLGASIGRAGVSTSAIGEDTRFVGFRATASNGKGARIRRFAPVLADLLNGGVSHGRTG